MSNVQFREIETSSACPLGGLDELLFYLGEPIQAHCLRYMPPRAEGKCRGGQSRPRPLNRGERLAALLRGLNRAFAARVRKLDAQFRHTMKAAEVDHSLQRPFIFVAVESEAMLGNTPHPGDVGRLGNQQAAGTHRELPEVHQVPVGGRAVLGHVLAHRRNHDTVGQFEPAKFEGGKKCAGHEQTSGYELRSRILSARGISSSTRFGDRETGRARFCITADFR